MDRHGARCSPEEFHRSVNVFFPSFESEVYDRERQDTWKSLPRLFDLLIGDWPRSDPAPLWLPGYARLSRRSYAFFGKLWSCLPERRRRMEADLIAAHAPNGPPVGVVWRKNS